MVKILLGADPELFMRNPNSGSFVSAHGAVPGTKHEPFKVPHGAIQVDGTALEFNIDPSATVDEFVNNLNAVQATLRGYVPGYNVVAEPVANYDADYFKWDVPQSAKELGCEPDYNGWTLEANPRPDPDGKPYRTGSGHIHIGWGDNFDVKSKEHFQQCAAVARQCDYYLGIYSLQWDKDPVRRSLYGKAGAFRVKPYGMEYRVMSNRWLASDALMKWVYNQAQLAMKNATADNWADKVYSDSARTIIDRNITDWEDHYPITLGVEKVPA